MNKKTIIITVLIIISGILYYNYSTPNILQKISLNRVIDGDTIEIENGLKIRLSGINVPEKGMPGYEDATNFLKTNLESQEIYFENAGTDRYGRYLGYIFVNNQNINQKILENGLGHLYYYEKDNHYSKLKQAEQKAHNNQLGIWQKSSTSDCFKLIELDYYDKDDKNETLTLQNNCNKEISVTIKDDATHIYKEKIPKGIWEKTFKDIFNDDGDTLYIWDEQGKIIVFYRYT